MGTRLTARFHAVLDEDTRENERRPWLERVMQQAAWSEADKAQKDQERAQALKAAENEPAKVCDGLATCDAHACPAASTQQQCGATNVSCYAVSVYLITYSYATAGRPTDEDKDGQRVLCMAAQRAFHS